MKVIYDYLRQRRHPSSYHQMDPQSQQQPPQHNGTGSLCSVGPTSASCGSRHIISNDSIHINKELGVGEFGVVQQGVWCNEEGKRIQVAIKCLSSQRFETSRIEFLKEATIMHAISHDHIVRLYGVVLEPSLMLVTELAPLRSLLECLKEPALISQFPIISLCNFAAQIADGMAYLESRRLIHRDLAARNILVFAKNKVKISDFGLSRALGVGKDYYQTNFNVNLKLPIAWCAPECINYLKFTSQSDVWAYGVTLWEMFSYGFQPWAALTGQQILEAIDEPLHQRLEPPECCPKEYYTLMLKCWEHDPNDRPKFAEIVTILPECKPEMVQAVNCFLETPNPSLQPNKESLSYKTGDIITVLDKRGSTLSTNSTSLTIGSNSSCLSTSAGAHDSTSNLWKGALNNGKTGFFNPSDCVSYLGQNLPTSSSQSLSSTASGGQTSATSTLTSHVLQSKFIRGFLDSKSNSHSSNQSSQSSTQGSPYGSRRRLRPDMISRPQGDLVHTGHVGADGVFFGDVSFLDGKYNQLPKQVVTPYRAQDDQNHSSYGQNSGSHSTATGARNKWINNEKKLNLKNASNSGDSSHEYHEISDEEDFAPLESPPFEILDFGPSLVEEVFRELDQIKPDLNNEINDSELAINESSVNVKNEVREINLKITKEVANTSKGKKQAMVKPISASDQIELDSAIAMAKDIATRSMLTFDNEMVDTKHDSPKTPNSPNKKKFSFKFSTSKSSPKTERRNFSEETESIGDIIESITPAAKEAYITLVDKGGAAVLPDNSSTIASIAVTTDIAAIDTTDDAVDANPLRMLRAAGIGGVLRAKVRGNRSFSQPRLPTTAQTAGLARVASTRSTLGVPPPVPTNAEELNNNALPLPPRDRSRPMLVPLKTHQRRHPLVLPSTNGDSGSGYDEYRDGHRRESSPLRIGHPVLKQVSCPQPPQTFLDNYSSMKSTNNDSNDSNCDTNYNKKVAPIPPPKPQRSYLGEESFESEIQKALDNIKMGGTCSTPPPESTSPTGSPNNNQINSNLNNYQKTITQCLSDSLTTNSLQNPSKSTTDPNLNSSAVVNSEQQSHQRLENGCTSGLVSDMAATVKSRTSSFESKPVRNRSVDCDEVRVMQKVLANEANLSSEECAKILHSTDWDVHKAIKCIRLRQQLRSHSIDVECDWAQMLSKFNWNIRQASNYLIATQGVPEDTTEV